ncbi:UNVERIFIED_CONTAM: hypothetical protein FKN15_036860 [Acipenser sinensis]
MAGRSYKKLMESLKTTRKPLDLEDINTLFLEDHEGMDPLEEDQPDELMMEVDRDEESVPDEPQPSTSTVNMVCSDADHAHSLLTKHRCTHRHNAPDRWSPDRSAPAHYTPARYTLAHNTASTPDAFVEPAPVHFVDGE